MNSRLKSILDLVVACALLTACGGGASGESSTAHSGGETGDGATPNMDQTTEDPPEQGVVTPRCETISYDPPSGDAHFSVGPVTARYFREDDGREPGVGTDGSDPAITAELVAEEIVDRPAINYSWDEFHNIDSYNFYATFDGTIEVPEDVATVYANFDLSWADASFYVDGVEVGRWHACGAVVPLALDAGLHRFRVEFHSHYHAAQFNVSFTNYKQISLANSRYELGADITESSDTWYVGTYGAASLHNTALVRLPADEAGITLVLSSYGAVNWIIDNPHNTLIKAVLFNSNEPGATVTGNGDAPIYQVVDLSGGYESFGSAADDIRQITGRNPTYVYGEYSLEAVNIGDSTNMLDTSVVGGNAGPLLDTYRGVNATNYVAESSASGQQVATYLPLPQETVVTTLKWNGRTRPTQFSAPGPQAFIIRIYEGEELPESLFAEEVVMVPPSLLYESTLGDVYDFTYSDSGIFVLPAGDYWVSIVDPETQELDFLWIMEADAESTGWGSGGAFRPTSESAWQSTVAELPARLAVAGSIYVEGVAVLR
jgi:hypothetical protein